MIQKQAFPIPFAQGLDTKTDPKQVQIGKFLSLQNSVFDKGGLLQKRNGYASLTALPVGTNAAYLTTLAGNLTAVGDTISAYNFSNATWVTKGTIQPMEVKTLPIIKNNINQTYADSVVSMSGMVLTAYSEINNATTDYKFVIADATTGQNIVSPVLIPAIPGGTISGSSRVFVVGSYFIVISQVTVGGSTSLQYFSITLSNLTISLPVKVNASSYVPTTSNPGWDGVSVGQNLVIAQNTTTAGQGVLVTLVTENQIYSNATSSTTLLVGGATYIASVLSICADLTASPNLFYVSFWNSGTTNGYTFAVNVGAGIISLTFAPVQIITGQDTLNLASAAQNGSCLVFEEVYNNYGYDASIPTHYLEAVTVSSSGVVGTPYTAVRSVGLASKGFIVNGVVYFLSAYQSPYQDTYFLINGSISTEAAPVVSGKLAYENGGGYLTLGLPSVTITDSNICQVAYLYKDFITTLNTLQNPQQTTTGGIYSQTGINLGTFTIGTENIDTAEIGGDLHISGGFLWVYDGYLPVEHNFFLWPDSVEATWSDTGGSMVANPPGWVESDPSYYYQAVYSWSDNQGNQFRSAPSIPIPVTFDAPDASTTGSVTIDIPTLRLTYKTANPVKIEIYRWSVANQNYYQVTSVIAPLLNNTTVDYVTFVDTLADASIIGNNIIYTTGGVVEDVNAPASNIMTLFDDRLWLVDAEDPNLLWYSKQVIESTPVEMSDLFTYYIPPAQAAQGSTGPITALAPMDDKLIIFKANALYYINGTGPDNTGANSQYPTSPIFITSVVGCSNQQSIVFTNQGLMFQSGKGIWIVGRDLSVSYIGAPVEQFNSSIVQSAVNVPLTNQVRFTLDTGQTLLYDYYFAQWGTFVGVPAISSCLYQDYHTFLNAAGGVLQESPGTYVDGANPVLMSFLTGHIQMQGLSGYQRIYELLLLGQYESPHLLDFRIGYDFGALSEQVTITPTNQTGVFGSDQLYGQTSPFGGPSDLEQWRIQPGTQKCQAFQIQLTEIYDPSYSTQAGAGFTLSALTCVLGFNRGYRPIKAANVAGTSQ